MVKMQVVKARVPSSLRCSGRQRTRSSALLRTTKQNQVLYCDQDFNRAGAQDDDQKPVILRAVPSPEGSDLGVETWSFADVEYDKRIYLIRNQSIK